MERVGWNTRKRFKMMKKSRKGERKHKRGNENDE